ncbi:hypothetical protein B4135_0595 [Caldibacillus debilis]|uniref:Uncharacterized protein n=1 Tax=Caldibacillus debilis TaxID=301148 RepID=A0A150MAM1_9BACI|nr:hypothetical protein B4135_0595 [Caldibacillus debilis]
MAVLPQEGWSLKPVPERPLTFFPEGKAVAGRLAGLLKMFLPDG